MARILSIHRGRVETFEADDGATVESAIRKQTCAGPMLVGELGTDGDGFGNACDGDFDQSGACNIDDFMPLLEDLVVGSGDATDMNGDGTVNISDFMFFLAGFLAGSPGPSGLAP